MPPDEIARRLADQGLAFNTPFNLSGDDYDVHIRVVGSTVLRDAELRAALEHEPAAGITVCGALIAVLPAAGTPRGDRLSASIRSLLAEPFHPPDTESFGGTS